MKTLYEHRVRMIDALKSLLGIKPLIRRAMRPRIARSALERKPALIVLIYHSIDADPPAHLTRMGVTTHPDAFDNHMRWAKATYEMVSLAEGVRRLRSGALRRTCIAVTFDDGFQTAVDYGLQALSTYDIPCTFFVNGAFLQGQRCWINEVARLETAGRTDVLQDIFGPCPGKSYLTYLRQSASAEVVAKRDLLKRHTPDTNGDKSELFDETCLANILQNPKIEIGNHSLDHPRFRTIGADEQQRQITENQRILSRHSSYQRLFALPFGKPHDWNFDTAAAVARTGHEFVSGCGGINFADSVGVDIRRIPCDGLGAGRLEERIISCGLGI